MMLLQHKLILALLLSGLVHGVLLFGDFNDQQASHSVKTQEDLLHLELVIEATATNKKLKPEVARESSNDTLISQQKAADRQVMVQSVIKKKPEEKTQHEQQQKFPEEQYEQKKHLSKAVENHEPLLQLVYQAINQYKRYPYMARRLGQQGKVTLNFVMHPDGQVTNVAVIESSQYSVLDGAAQAAVVAIAPFARAADYLQDEKVFDIAVDFRLN